MEYSSWGGGDTLVVVGDHDVLGKLAVAPKDTATRQLSHDLTCPLNDRRRLESDFDRTSDR
jgi:hypothetical protein